MNNRMNDLFLKVFHKGNPFLVFTSFAVFAKLLNVQEHKGTGSQFG